jgi:hypothetical protein
MGKSYTGLTVWADRREDQGAWVFGVTLDGADVVLFGRKLGGVDGDIAAAKAVAAQAASDQAPSPQNEPPVDPGSAPFADEPTTPQ